MPNPPVSEITITRALVSLRFHTIREGRPGLEHIEALLAMRGSNLAPVPAKRTIRFRKGELQRIVLGAPRDGPKDVRTVGDCIHAHRPAMGRDVAYQRASVVLSRMKRRGLVEQYEGGWRSTDTAFRQSNSGAILIHDTAR